MLTVLYFSAKFTSFWYFLCFFLILLTSCIDELLHFIFITLSNPKPSNLLEMFSLLWKVSGMQRMKYWKIPCLKTHNRANIHVPMAQVNIILRRTEQMIVQGRLVSRIWDLYWWLTEHLVYINRSPSLIGHEIYQPVSNCSENVICSEKYKHEEIKTATSGMIEKVLETVT